MISKCAVLLILIAFVYPIKALSSTLTLESGETITTDKIVYIRGQFDRNMQVSFFEDIAKTRFMPGTMIIDINSVGGILEVGQKMIQLLEEVKSLGVRVVCFVSKEADSMAFNFLTHCSERTSIPNATFLVHKLRYYSQERDLTAVKLREIALEIDADDEPFRQDNSKAMGLSLEKYDAYANKESNWSAKTLKNRGYLHSFAKFKK